MGRRRNTTTKYYCPKCERKTLVRDSDYNHTTRRYQQGWVCTNQPPKQYSAIIALLTDGDPNGELDSYEPYFSYEARHGGYGAEEKAKMVVARAAEVAKVKAYMEKRPACDCKIFHVSRDATIQDYCPTVLDRMVRGGEAVKHHIFENDSDVHRKGFEVLYSSEDMDLVRMRDDHGVAVWLYWKCSWDPDRSKSEIKWDALQHEAANYIKHGDLKVSAIFANAARYAVWTKPVKESERHYRLRNVPFTGSLGKRKKAELVAWAKDLEANLKGYESAAVLAEADWRAWGIQLKAGVRSRSNKVSVSNYNGKSQLANISIRGMLTQNQINAVAAVLRDTPE